jgi:hypothetical protein
VQLSLVATAALTLTLVSFAAPADDPLASAPKPGTLIIVGQGRAEGRRIESLIYGWDRKTAEPRLLSRQRSVIVGEFHAIAFAQAARYYLSGNRNMLIRADKDGEEVIYRHPTYVRDLALVDQNDVYFSEASGAGGDGKIYRLVPNEGANPGRAELFCAVRLVDVGGYWAGDFAFGRHARGGSDTDTIYLSSGNRVPASIYQMTRKAGAWGQPEVVFGAETSIQGLVMSGPRDAYYVSKNQVFQLTNFVKLKAVLTLPAVERLSDLTIAPEQP